MVEHMLDFMLGPLRGITDLYMNNLLYCNIVVFLGYFGAKIFKKKKVTSEQN
ncbi:hypothetical protein [Staphylococcus equorum]|uniref:hypothetical protein n=1 Tax=Staphylococcus equorum TaxID=246432 RepID=UPI0025528F80|nr:hypothetical protein [Staphylococcus equorum]MDK9857322.1 hypothetical protein [Staphylococcus equorum]MDK9874002.1 hypothetical protein [Staphylococcus equorum]